MTIHRTLLASVLMLLIASVAAGVAAEPNPSAGFIHATVTWPSGQSRSGYLRWENEEAYWDDLFHSGYRDAVWGEYVDLDEMKKLKRDEYFKTHGLLDRLAYALNEDDDDVLGRLIFVSRFGDLRAIEIHDGDDDFVVTADGARHQIGGYARDAGSPLLLYVAGEDQPKRIRWNDLARIEFSPAPVDQEPYAERLWGTLETTGGTFEGFIQWDKSENTSRDELDGQDDEGNDVELPMGRIRSISKTRQNTARVETTDGRIQVLRGTNDVNSDNRGIMIEVEEVGKITVPWNRFERVTFESGHGSGRGRESYDHAATLSGTLRTHEGEAMSGQLVLDLDEGFAWDLFNGTDRDGLDYDIPLHEIVRLQPGDEGTCRVTLRSGAELVLQGQQDTGIRNRGALVFAGDGRPEHVVWSRIESIELDP